MSVRTQLARQPAGRDGGFTLVEMLVALALLGMASLMIAQGLSVGHGLWRKQTTLAARGEAVEAAQTLLRGRIERLSPITRYLEGKPMADLNGSSDRFAFIALAPDAERPAPPRRFTISRDQDNDLVLSGAPLRGGAPRDQVLLRRIAGVEFAYFGSGQGDQAVAWRADWPEQTTLPRLVRVRVAFPEGDKRVWPDLIVQPAASVDTACHIDPDNGECRGRS